MARRSTCEPVPVLPPQMSSKNRNQSSERCPSCEGFGLVYGGVGIPGRAIQFCPLCWGAATEEAYIEFHYEGKERDAVLAYRKWLQERDA